MAELPIFHENPALRCFHQAKLPSGRYCARPAVALRAGHAHELPEYFCGKHTRPGDVPIGAAPALRRVRLTVQVDFAAVTWSSGGAHTEAVERLQRAVVELGGVVNLVNVTSAIGRTPGEPGLGARTASGGRR